MIPIYCVNLKRAYQRRQYIQYEWVIKLKFQINFWEAYDRIDIEKGIFRYPYDSIQTKAQIGRELNSGEIACSTSFCSLYEHILEKNLYEVIIIEDDIIPKINNKNQLYNMIDVGKAEFPQAEIMLLHEPEPKDRVWHDANCIIRKNFFSLCVIPPWGNQMFYSTKTGIEKMYSILKNMTMPADEPQKFLAKEDLVILSNIGLCEHFWTGSQATSYIPNNYRNTYRKFIK